MKELDFKYIKNVLFHPYFPEDKDVQLSDEYNKEDYTLSIDQGTGIPTYIIGMVACGQEVISVIVASPASPEDTAIDANRLRFIELNKVAYPVLIKLLNLCLHHLPQYLL